METRKERTGDQNRFPEGRPPAPDFAQSLLRMAATAQGRCDTCSGSPALGLLLPDGSLICMGISFVGCCVRRGAPEVFIDKMWMPGYDSVN